MAVRDRKLTGLETSKKLLEEISTPVDIEAIKISIPIIQSLHPSFWASKKFLVWQIIRLNRDYQEFSKNLWRSIGENLFTFNFFFIDVPPFPKETFDEWNDRLDNDCSRHIETICSDLSPHTEDPGIAISRSNFIAFLKSFNKQLNAKFVPIPWKIRFPLPILLDDFSRYPAQRLPKKRRPAYWGLNLLIYELSQAGMKDKPMAALLRESASELLFGVVKSYSGKSDKDPLLGRIADIREWVQGKVFKAYPIS